MEETAAAQGRPRGPEPLPGPQLPLQGWVQGPEGARSGLFMEKILEYGCRRWSRSPKCMDINIVITIKCTRLAGVPCESSDAELHSFLTAGVCDGVTPY